MGPPPDLPPPRAPLYIVGTDRSYSSDLIACAVVTTVIAAVFVAMRIFTRKFLLNLAGLEDWLIVASLVFSIGLTAGTVYGMCHFRSFGSPSMYWRLSVAWLLLSLDVLSSSGTPRC